MSTAAAASRGVAVGHRAAPGHRRAVATTRCWKTCSWARSPGSCSSARTVCGCTRRCCTPAAGCPSAAASGAGRTWARCAACCPARWRTASRHRRTSSARLAERWPAVRDGVLAAIDWRTNARERSLERVLAERAQEEQERIADRLDRFAHTLRRKLAERRHRPRAGADQPGRGREEPRRARAVSPRPAVVGRAPRPAAARPGTRAGRRRAPLRRPAAAPLPGGGRVRGPATGGRAMSGARDARAVPPAVDPVRQHRDWLALVEVTGPFLSLPVLRETWPTLDADRRGRARHPAPRRTARGATTSTAGQRALGRVRAGRPARLGRRSAMGRRRGPDRPGGRPARARHDGRPVVRACRAGSAPTRCAAGEVKPDATCGCSACCATRGSSPTARIPGSAWAATPVDRVAQLCRAPRRPARPGHRRPLVGAGLRAARRRHVGRGVRRRGLAGGGRPRRGAGVPLAAGAPPVLRRARRRAPPCAAGSAAKTARKTSPRPSACRSARPSSCW